LALFFGVVPLAVGGVSTKVCMADGETPLPLVDPNMPHVYRDIMVGTKLTIIVSSDAGGYWSGKLAITGQDRDYGFLSARDYNETTLDWAGSRFPAASNRARVWDWQGDPGVQGFSLRGHRSTVAGDWFIIDYTVISVGTCNVKFFDDSVSLVDPVYSLVFSHVPKRDFNNDTIVNCIDFAIFASYWRQLDCTDPMWCTRADLDSDGDIDSNDLRLFADYWLAKTE
jgi:hypothetical protein